MNRFGKASGLEISEAIESLTPTNTVKTHKCIWKQFLAFCEERKYDFLEQTSNEHLAGILKDWAFNMKRADGTDYKEGVVKTIWNISAKLLQKKYFEDFNRKIDPFKDIVFEDARKARAAKRRELQALPEKRKSSSAALTTEEISKIVENYDENSPDGLQKKFYQISAVELAWRGNEATFCLVEFFNNEVNIYGEFTGRIEYNTVFSKTTQGGEKHTAASKWLTSNKECQDKCPVRLLQKMLSKRTPNIKTNRLFLTPNPDWKKTGIWYKNCPMGLNQLSKWTRLGAQSIGINTKKVKITNHSNRSSTVSNLTKSGANLQEVIQITGHSSSESLKPYLKLSNEHHLNIVEKMRKTTLPCSTNNIASSSSSTDNNVSNIIYNNCTFNINTK